MSRQIRPKRKRMNLEKYKGMNMRVSGQFIRFGNSDNEGEENSATAIITNIMYEGKMICDHGWIIVNDEFKDVELDNYNIIEFDTRITEYASSDGLGYVLGYKFDKIKNVEVIDRSSSHGIDIEQMKLVSSFSLEKEYSFKRSRRAKLEERYPNYARESRKIRNASKIHFILESIEKNGDMKFRFSTAPNPTNLNQFKEGAVFNMKDLNKMVIMETFVIALDKSDFTNLSNAFFKIHYTKTNIDLPLSLSPKEMQAVINNNFQK